MNENYQSLGDLQMLVMEQERAIEQLGELLVDHQAQIDRLLNRIELLENRLSRYAEGGELTDQNQVPPHY